MIFVLSVTRKQADDWGRKNLLRPNEYRFISNVQTLYGQHRHHKFVKVGQYYKRTDIVEIEDELAGRFIDATADYAEI